MSNEYCRPKLTDLVGYVEPIKMLCSNLSICARIPFIRFISVLMRRSTCSCSAPVQLQLRLVGFCLRPGAATPLGMARHYRAVGYGTAEPGLWCDRTSAEPYLK